MVQVIRPGSRMSIYSFAHQIGPSRDGLRESKKSFQTPFHKNYLTYSSVAQLTHYKLFVRGIETAPQKSYFILLKAHFLGRIKPS